MLAQVFIYGSLAAIIVLLVRSHWAPKKPRFEHLPANKPGVEDVVGKHDGFVFSKRTEVDEMLMTADKANNYGEPPSQG